MKIQPVEGQPVMLAILNPALDLLILLCSYSGIPIANMRGVPA